jgi:NADH-ubiquinone oxidoreductase chain 5
LFSIFFGYIFSDLFLGVGTDFFGNSLFIHPNNISIIEAEFSLNIGIKLLPCILSLIGATLCFYSYHYTPEFLVSLSNYSLIRKLYTFLNGKYLFDVVYNNYIVKGGLITGYIIAKVLDRGVIELIGPYGISNSLNNTSLNISKLDTGVVTTYSLYITLGLLTLLLMVFSPFLVDLSSVSLAEAGVSSLLSEIRLFIIFIATLVLLYT